MGNNVLLSILIPTKNRIEYTFEVVKHILSLTDNRFELVIQDNSSSVALQNLLIENGFCNDKRLFYNYTQEELSFVDNFGKAIDNCSGDYVIIIGDDDTINPKIIDIAQWAYINDIDAVTPTLPLVYNWPGSGVNSLKESGYLDVVNFNCSARFFDARNEVLKLLENGCQNYLDFNLAKAYHGIVKKSKLDEIKNQVGYYIGGLSPDIYLSVAVSLLVDRVLVIDYPLTISGICKKSGSADSATGKHTGDLKQAPHFKGHDTYKWSELIPEFYSVETIWGDSAVAALTDLGENKLLRKFSVSAISAYCYVSYPKYKEYIIQNIIRNSTNKNSNLIVKLFLLRGFLKIQLSLLKRKVKNRINNKTKLDYFDNINSIDVAVKVIETILKNKEAELDRNLHKIKKQINGKSIY